MRLPLAYPTLCFTDPCVNDELDGGPNADFLRGGSGFDTCTNGENVAQPGRVGTARQRRLNPCDGWAAVMYQGRIVEQGNVDEVLSRPQHPYAQRFLAAVPKIG